MFKKRRSAIFDKRTQQSYSEPDHVHRVGWETIRSDTDRKWKHRVIYNGGAGGYAVAVGELIDGPNKGKRVCAVRWNGEMTEKTTGQRSLTGMPAHGGSAEWLVLPEFLWIPTIEACERLNIAIDEK